MPITIVVLNSVLQLIHLFSVPKRTPTEAEECVDESMFTVWKFCLVKIFKGKEKEKKKGNKT